MKKARIPLIIFSRVLHREWQNYNLSISNWITFVFPFEREKEGLKRIFTFEGY